MKNIKKIIISTLLLFLVLSSIFASTKLASTEDGKIYLLKDDNTYERFEAITYENPMGYKPMVSTQIKFIDKTWDSVSLIALGNYLKPSNSFSLGSFTSGEYFLLQLKENLPKNKSTKVDKHNIPEIKLTNGSLIKGINESIQYSSSSSWFSNKENSKILTYKVLYEMPEDTTPLSVVFTDKNNSKKELTLGSFKKI